MDKESLVILTLAKSKRRCYLNNKCLVFLIIVFIIVLSIILHSHLFLAKSEVLLSEAKDQREKDAREERAVWKKTESKILMSPNHLSWENKNGGEGGVQGKPLFTLMVSRWCGWRLNFLALPQPASRMAARQICYNPACTVATPQTLGFELYATHPRGLLHENGRSGWHSPVIHVSASGLSKEKKKLFKLS